MLGDHFMDRSLFRFVGRAAPHPGPALWAQGLVYLVPLCGFVGLRCIPEANSWFRESLVLETSIPAAPCYVVSMLLMLSVFIDFLRKKNPEALSL